MDGTCQTEAAALVPLNGTCTATEECEANLTCFDMTCMDIPATSGGDACTMDVECARINGAAVGECRNMMCGFVPARLEGERCDYGFDCDEELECQDMVCTEPLA